MISLILAAVCAISSDRIEVKIDDATGALVSLTDKRDGTRLLERSCDAYKLQRGPNDEISAGEAEDRVVGKRGDTLICKNPKLPGLRIEKTWRVEGRVLVKRVAFATDAKDMGFLKYSTASTAAAGFYRDGYLNDPSRHPLDYPYIFVKDIKNERKISDYSHAADHHYAIFTNPKQNRGLGQYRFKVDDRFVHPLTGYSYEPGLYYTPTGWRIAVAGQWMTTGQKFSTEVRWRLFDGDHTAFHRELTAEPEYAAQWDFESPAWVKDVRATAAWVYGESSPEVAPFKARADALDNGYLMVMIGGVFCNTRNYMADPIAAPCGMSISAADLRKIIDELHALSPRIKVGPVVWQWAFGPLDSVYVEHPEWTVHDGAGKPVFACTGWTHEKVFSQLMTPECREHNQKQFRDMVKRYDFDFIYMDSGQGGVTQFDWRTKRCAQDYDWADFYKGIRDAARSNRNGATFFNGTPRLYSSFCDCGYFEGIGIVKERDWRALSDRLFLVKLYQPGEKWTMPLYWHVKETSQAFINYCMVLALKPGSFLEGGIADSTRWPLAAACNELRDLRLAPEANPRPCWWKEKTEVEAYCLRFPGGAFLNAIAHGADSQTTTVSCDLEPLGFDAAKPINVWLFRPQSLAWMQKNVGVTESEAAAIFFQEGNAPYRAVESKFVRSLPAGERRFEQSLSIEPNTLQMVMLTQADKLAYAIDGHPTHFLLPPPSGAKAMTVSADRPVPPEIVASREGFVLSGDRHTLANSPIEKSSSPKTATASDQKLDEKIGGVELIRRLTVICEHNKKNAAEADAKNLTLHIDSGWEKLQGFASAAFEAGNLGAVELAMKRKGIFWAKEIPPINGSFVGFVVDYHTAKGYTRRVKFPLGAYGANAQSCPRPWFGAFNQKDAEQPYMVPLNWSDTMRIDLGKYAPKDWDGRTIFGVHLDNCGIGTELETRITGNGPAGKPLADIRKLAEKPAAAKEKNAKPENGLVGKGEHFQGADIFTTESGAAVTPSGIVFPTNGAIEAAGLNVVSWKLDRKADSKQAELWINYEISPGKYKLYVLPLQQRVRPGQQANFDVDFRENAPKNWTGRCRCRLVGDGVTGEITGNTAFQIF